MTKAEVASRGTEKNEVEKLGGSKIMGNLDFSLVMVSDTDPGKVSELESDVTEPQEAVHACG